MPVLVALQPTLIAYWFYLPLAPSFGVAALALPVVDIASVTGGHQNTLGFHISNIEHKFCGLRLLEPDNSSLKSPSFGDRDDRRSQPCVTDTREETMQPSRAVYSSSCVPAKDVFCFLPNASGPTSLASSDEFGAYVSNRYSKATPMPMQLFTFASEPTKPKPGRFLPQVQVSHPSEREPAVRYTPKGGSLRCEVPSPASPVAAHTGGKFQRRPITLVNFDKLPPTNRKRRNELVTKSAPGALQPSAMDAGRLEPASPIAMGSIAARRRLGSAPLSISLDAPQLTSEPLPPAAPSRPSPNVFVASDSELLFG